ncbi:MAG: hypothetical protein ACFFAQ_08860 [Promethearchaeota archaeon]
MSQDINEMKFCESCKMNVFPSRPKFNIKIFGLFIILISAILIPLTIVSIPLLSGFFIFLFIMYGFMFINPYLIYYGIKKKQNCPRCFQKVVEKNLQYQPFGEKDPEVFKSLAPVKKPATKVFCPYCGNPMSKKGQYCKLCGKKFEIKR